ncbi:MAG: hypothetical protein HOV81_23170 [Kofleriaceae bacterium]|nr:hypothetical protein [Kofleriaceae bacterium]
MRVIDQARLWFREGTSDKVYEVDLVEVATGQCVVNFRFGRRGGPLKDGTKTSLPVPLDKARGIFGKLVDEKLAGGYQHAAAAAAPRPAATPAPVPAASAPPAGEAARLVGYLRQGSRSSEPIGRVVWRVTDLDLREAEPALLELLGSAFVPRKLVADQWKHMLVTALARCGSPAALPALEAVIADLRSPVHLRDIARLAIARIDPARGRALGTAMLPPQVKALFERGDAQALARTAEELLDTNITHARATAVGLYLINDAVARPAVLAMARVARLSNAEAQVVRVFFRLAETRRDGELYALVARRIDAYGGVRKPFAPQTRQYLRRRVARVLRRLGRAASPDYVTMASSILLGYDDEDAVQVKTGLFRHTYDQFAPFHAFNQILYTHSTRYEKGHHKHSFWITQRGYRPGGPAPHAREEAHPELWDRAPNALWELLLKSGTTPVIELATRALRANAAFTQTLRDEQLAHVLATGHPLAQRFAYDVARGRPLSIALARGALASDVADAHAWVLGWIDAHPDETLADADLLALIITGKTAQIREAALRLVRSRPLSDAIAKSAAARSLAILLGLADTPANVERATGAVAVILRVLEVLRDIGPDVLRDLVMHPLAPLGELAGELILRHSRRDSLPGELIEAMLMSPHASVRLLGGRILATTPPEIAKDDLEALVLFSTSGNAELREATRTLIAEVARRYPDVGRALADRLVDALLHTQPPGAPAHVVSLLRAELAAVLPKKSPQAIMKLVGALSPHARDAGGLLLPQLGPDDLGLDDIARLASHESRAIREGAWALARASVARYRLAPVALAKLVDSAWDDTRAWAIAFIRNDVGGDKLGADAIITICDSIRPEVQDLGKSLLHEQFKEADAGRYLVRLAEHPSTNLQLLVSGLLDRYATDVEKLAILRPYLATVLSQVNRGRVAKERVIALLRREAAKSAEAAAVLAPLLDRQSATMAVTQKHPLIATMVDVHHLYPDVPLPISVIPPKGVA